MDSQHTGQDAAPAVEMTGVTRRFARVVANDDVSLEVRRGEIHALVGENGAGKSTLMKILYGLYRPDSGTIRVHGREVRFRSPHDAIAAGIGMVHQHFMLVPPFTVTENIMLGREEASRGFIDNRTASARVAELAARYQIGVDPDAVTGDLSVGQQQRVEILKILYRSADIVILDEPTAVLTPQEVDQLFVTVRGLRDAGHTIILITHKLREVMALSQRLTVLRGGRKVADLMTAQTTPSEIARLMVGREVVLPTVSAAERKKDAEEGDAALRGAPALRLAGVTLRRPGGTDVVSDVSLEVHPGEVLGIAGVEGNGQSELVDLITGLRVPTAGSIEIAGRDVTRFSPRRKFAAGLACIPSDRQHQGLVLPFSLRDNLRLGRYGDRSTRGRHWASDLLARFDVRPPNPRQSASQLSGGNQQKVIVAREFTRGAAVLVAAQPTRGVDLGAIEFIHRQLLDLRAQGVAILLVSAELSEILALSDRVAVMYGGRIVYLAPNWGLTEHDLGIHMAGGGGGGGAAA